MYKIRTLKSKASDFSPANREADIKIPRFVTNPMQESGTISSVGTSKKKSMFKFGTITTPTEKSSSVPKLKSLTQFQFGTKNSEIQLDKIKPKSPYKIMEVAEDN